ncbi:hypothetical protein [Jidongwangia harbinensis]|uniref:hypothetical protein n=1 Tax=Jidongwangia harbinensis TaxID=2878561 RepID=UPI001CDA05F7|nr:hypothetical protein [Jidongwangia harbinensis]MCA2214080.1 hypothetical protein [Jidongwangia harbinensis]
MAEDRHFSVPYDDTRDVQIRYQVIQHNLKVFIPASLPEASRMWIPNRLQEAEPTVSGPNVVYTNEISNTLNFTDGTSWTPDHQDKVGYAKQAVQSYLDTHHVNTPELQSTLSSASISGDPMQFAAQYTQGQRPGNMGQMAATEGITTPGDRGARQVLMNGFDQPAPAYVHESWHTLESNVFQGALRSPLSKDAIEGMTEYLTQQTTGLDFRRALDSEHKPSTLYSRETSALELAMKNGELSQNDVHRSYLRGSESPTGRVEAAHRHYFPDTTRKDVGAGVPLTQAPGYDSNPFSFSASQGHDTSSPGQYVPPQSQYTPYPQRPSTPRAKSPGRSAGG